MKNRTRALALSFMTALFLLFSCRNNQSVRISVSKNKGHIAISIRIKEGLFRYFNYDTSFIAKGFANQQQEDVFVKTIIDSVTNRHPVEKDRY